MRTSSAQFAAEISGTETDPVAQLLFTWPAGIAGVPVIPISAVQAITPQASYTTDMPEGTKLVEGYPARLATIVLSGIVGTDETQTAQWLFDDYSTTSPLYRQDWTGPNGVQVVYNQGLQLLGVATAEVFPQFTGYVDKVQAINRSTGEVTLSLIDTRSQLRTAPQLPMVIADNSILIPPGTIGGNLIRPGLTSLWFIDYLLRANGIYTAPPARAGCVFYLSGHGSLWPEIFGTVQAVNSGGNPDVPVSGWLPGRFAGQAPSDYEFTGTLAAPVNDGTGGGHYLQFWMLSDTRPAINNDTTITVGNLYVQFIGDGSTGSIECEGGFVFRNGNQYAWSGSLANSATGFTYHQVGVQITFPTTTTARIRVYYDGNPTPAVDTTVTGLPVAAAGDATHSGITVAANWATEALQVTTETAAVPTPASYTAGADLDASLNNLNGTPAYDVSDAWALIQQITAAEFAVAGFDEAGRPFFRNRLNRPTAAQATITSTGAVKDIQFSKAESTRARTVTALAHPLAAQLPAVVWSASEIVLVTASSTKRVIASLTSPAGFIPAGFGYYPASGGPVAPFSANSYRAAYRRDYGHAVSNLSIVASMITSSAVAIDITNPNGFDVALVDYQTGAAALYLVGQTLAASAVDPSSAANSDGSVTVTANGSTGQPVLQLIDTPWRQDTASTQAICDDTLSDLYRPRPMFDQLVIVGDPRLQLGDRIQIQDAGEAATSGSYRAGAPIADDAIILQISPSYDVAGGFIQTIVARAVASPGQWVLGQAGHSELGSTTWI